MNSENQTAIKKLHDDITQAVNKIEEDSDDELVRIHTIDNDDGA